MLWFLFITVYSIYQQCNGYEFTSLSDYITEVNNAVTANTLTVANTAFPNNLKEPLEQFRDLQNLVGSTNPFKREVHTFEIPVQFEIGKYIRGIDGLDFARSTLKITFHGSSDFHHDHKTNLEFKYVSLDLFNYANAARNNIGIHAGIVRDLYDQTFNNQFQRALQDITDAIQRLRDNEPRLRQRMMTRDGHVQPWMNNAARYTFTRLLITGYSLGGAYAQLFYFLLYGEDNNVPPAVHAIRHLLNINQNNIYNPAHNTITTPILPNPNVDVFVITAGAFLVLPNANNGITVDNLHNFIDLSVMANMIEHEDPVPMVFGGAKGPGTFYQGRHTIPPKKHGALVVFKASNKLLRGLGTATTTCLNTNTRINSNYYVLFKQTNNEVKILKLIDFPNDGPKYFTKHLIKGNSQLGLFSVVSPALPILPNLVMLGIQYHYFSKKFQKYHNAYDADLGTFFQGGGFPAHKDFENNYYYKYLGDLYEDLNDDLYDYYSNDYLNNYYYGEMMNRMYLDGYRAGYKAAQKQPVYQRLNAQTKHKKLYGYN